MKAQAAMEFLMTYGWAILIVIIMISALGYLGILSPNSYAPDKCFFSAGIGCSDFYAEPDGTGVKVELQLVNNFGRQITVLDVEPRPKGTNLSCECSPPNYCGIGGVWLPEAQKSFTMSCADSDIRVDYFINVRYKIIDGKYERLIEGEVQLSP